MPKKLKERPMPYVTVNDARLYYEDQGTGPALLFLHGWGTSARVWGAQQADLVADYRIVGVDWRGCGRSARPVIGNTIDGVVADLVAVVGALELQRPVVIGSSMGAVFATELALRHPDLAGGVISVDGPGYWPSQGMDLDELADGLRENRAGFVADWVTTWYAPGTPPALLDWSIRQVLDSGPYIDAQIQALVGYDPRPDLPGLRVPVHYLHGELDSIPVEVAYQCAACTPGAEVTVIPGAGHMPHQERPASFNAALRHALEQMLVYEPAA
jgi:non-heme chloroperoxidase